MDKNMSDYEKIGYHLKVAILDSFCDYGGVDNVVDGLMAIAKAINRLADSIDTANNPPGGGEG